MSTLSANTIQPLSGTTITISSDLTVTGNITGTISGTVTNAATASYVAASNVVGTVTNAATASYVVTAQTASYVAATNIDGTITNATSASYIDGADVEGYVNNANSADSVFTTTSILPPGNYPILLGSPGVVDNFSGVYSKTNLSFNPLTNNLTASGSILISGSLIPNTDGVSITSSFDLGSPTNAWKDIYVSNGTINFLDGAGNVQGTLGTGTNATVITGSLQVVPINPLTGFTTTNGTLLHKSYTTADCAFTLYDSTLSSTNLGIYWNTILNDGKSLVLPWDKKITAYSLVNNIPSNDSTTSTVVTLPPIYNAGYSTGEIITIYNLGEADLGYKTTGSIFLVGGMQGVTNVNTSSKQITGTQNSSYVLSGSWGNYTQVFIGDLATTSSIKINPGQKATFEIVYWGTIYATPSSSISGFSEGGYATNFTDFQYSTTLNNRYLFKGIENL